MLQLCYIIWQNCIESLEKKRKQKNLQSKQKELALIKWYHIHIDNNQELLNLPYKKLLIFQIRISKNS